MQKFELVYTFLAVSVVTFFSGAGKPLQKIFFMPNECFKSTVFRKLFIIEVLLKCCGLFCVPVVLLLPHWVLKQSEIKYFKN